MTGSPATGNPLLLHLPKCDSLHVYNSSVGLFVFNLAFISILEFAFFESDFLLAFFKEYIFINSFL